MMERIWAFVVYWGVWLIVPALIDGISTLITLVRVGIARWRMRKKEIPPLRYYPMVTIIIPVYNGANTLARCLEAIRRQNYPQERLEVIVVDNGSTDNTAEVFRQEQTKPFQGQMHWMSLSIKGKPFALNAGIHVATGQYVANVDADTALRPDAIQEMVRHFEADPKLGAATGTIEVAPPPEGTESRLTHLIAGCEFLEYLGAFWLGRQGQTVSDSLYTLAGAFSFFRRDVLLRTFLYDQQTVSEDTKLTFDVRVLFGGERIACIPEAVAVVEPTPTLSALYAQRVRWQRGQLEVAAVHAELMRMDLWRTRGLALGRTLLVDHTLLFPRLVWTFLFPALYFFGYPLALVVGALLATSLFYMLMDAASMAMVYAIAPEPTRARMRKLWWMVTLLPAYHFMLFLFRLAGSILTLAEPATWRVQDPLTQVREAVRQYRARRTA